MTGHVFHPGHHELHGITVVLETTGSRTYVGRFDSQDERGVLLHDVGVHDASVTGPTREEFLRRSAKFGIRADHKNLLVPSEQVARVTRFSDLAGDE
ncbi:MAG TPA: hypothetical protein VIG08_13235 [Gemmatimonadales bacterium]|jgi:hypothetical protein